MLDTKSEHAVKKILENIYGLWHKCKVKRKDTLMPKTYTKEQGKEYVVCDMCAMEIDIHIKDLKTFLGK